jgi:TRAP-type C4-dicarboxylate transport system permease small subunit
MIETLARACTWAGVIALLVMMVCTDWDVVMRQLAGRPLNGVVELVEVTVLATALLGLPEAFLRDEQIRVDLIDTLVPPAVLAVIRAAGMALAVVFLTLLCRNVWQPMLDARMFGDVKYDIGIAVWPLYALILFAFGASILTCIVAMWRDLSGGRG